MQQADLYESRFWGFAWVVNDLSAILYVLIFFAIVDQLKLKLSYRYIIFGLLIVIAPCISHRFLVSSHVPISTILIILSPISVIGIEYLIGLTNLIQFRGPDEYKIPKVELLANRASMRIVFSMIILFFLLKEGISEGMINPLLLIVLAVNCFYIARIGLLCRKM